jgi:endonuclease/exonuclease/phosphatase (EEP) superfamily protein YafD
MNEPTTDAAHPGPATVEETPPAESPAGRWFRRPGPWAKWGGLLFAAGILGALLLCAVYHWPGANVPVYYFVTRPAPVWFAMLIPLLLLGAPFLRFRWLLLGAVVWLLAACACDDGYRVLRPFSARAKEKFEVARMAFRSYTSTGAPLTDDAEIPLRILTWNVRSGTEGAKDLAREIAAVHPDILLMQELAWGSKEEMIDAVRLELGLAGYFFKPEGHLGILSRFPLTKVESPLLAPYTHSVWDVEVAPGRLLRCVNVHLPPPELKTQVLRGWSWSQLSDAVDRNTRYFNALRSISESAGCPVLIGGDFNLSRHYPDVRRGLSGLKECFADNGYGWGKTAPAKLPAVRVDMLFVPKDVQVAYSAAVPTRYSDHYGMLAEILLPVSAPNARRD